LARVLARIPPKKGYQSDLKNRRPLSIPSIGLKNAETLDHTFPLSVTLKQGLKNLRNQAGLLDSGQRALPFHEKLRVG